MRSSFFISNQASDADISSVVSKLGFQQHQFPLIYLGGPISHGRPCCVFFDGILHQLRSRLQSWSSRMLSAGNKIILIHRVLLSVPMYLFQTLQPPKAVFESLGKICNGFLWDRSTDSRSIHWSSWNKLCFPIEEGGFGSRDFEDSCNAFHCKLRWQL